MAGPNKRSKKPSEAKSESSSDESEAGTYHGQQEIQATFEGRNPENHDLDGIKQLLKQLFLRAHVDLSHMSELLINQTGVGSVLKQSIMDSDDEEDTDMVDESDVFGITSVLRLTACKTLPCIDQFYSLIEDLSKKHASKEVQDTITRILQQKKVGLLINERFVNIPAKISTVMLQSLLEEIERKQKKDETYRFEYLVMICKTLRPKGQTQSEEFFANDEELMFFNASDCSFDFNVEEASDTGLAGRWMSEDQQMVPYRRVVLFEAGKLKNIIEKVYDFVKG